MPLPLKSYNVILKKLREARKPLSIDGQKRLAELLELYRIEHDSTLWLDTEINISAPQPPKKKYYKTTTGWRRIKQMLKNTLG